MPPLPLTHLMQTALPYLSTASRAIVSTLGCLNGKAPSAEAMATWVGLRDRYQLRRVLRRDGLPPLKQLAAWSRVLYWMLETESSGTSLRQVAQRERVDPAAAYRLVHRVTGQSWSHARRAGLALAVGRLRERCDAHPSGPRTPTAELPRPAPGPGSAAGGLPARAATSRPQCHPLAVLAERCLVAGSPFDVAITGDNSAFVTRVRAAAVDVLQLEPFGVVASVPTGPAPTRVVVSRVGTHAYVTSQFAEQIEIIDVPNLRQAGAIPVPGHAHGVALPADGRRLFATTNLDRLCALALPKGNIAACAPLPMSSLHPTVHPSGRRVYVPCWNAGVIVEFDAYTLRETRRFGVGGIAQDLALSSDGLRLYAANQGGWLNVIHLMTGRLTTVPLDSSALGVALSPDEAVLLVGLVFAGRVLAIDPRTLNVRTTLHTGGKPRLIAFDRSGRRALIANEAGWVDLLR